MPNNLPSINLIKNKEIPLFDKFLNWALTIGRLIIIITETVAVLAFVYRFSLDDNLVNLHSSIKQQQNIIAALKNDENKYRDLQSRIALAATFSENGTKTYQTITGVTNLLFNQLKIDNFIFNKDKINLDVSVPTVSALANLIESLKGNHNLKSISIDNIENKPSVGLSVSVTAMLK